MINHDDYSNNNSDYLDHPLRDNQIDYFFQSV